MGQRPADEEERADRRAAPRLDKVFAVHLEGNRGGALGIARNISHGGMFIETRDPPPIGSQVRVTFSAASGDMTALAEVRYVCHLIGCVADGARRHVAVRGMGVRFLYFEPRGDAPTVVH